MNVSCEISYSTHVTLTLIICRVIESRVFPYYCFERVFLSSV